MDTSSQSEGTTEIRQQEVVAELGQQALETEDVRQLMHDAAVAVTETLDNEYCSVLELLPGGDKVLLRQGIGWREEVVGNVTVPTDMDSEAGYTLLSKEPVLIDDLRTEERFSGAELLTSNDVVSGICVIIGSIEDPWGVLGTYTTSERKFTEHDANFVQSVANVLASAIGNEETGRKLNEVYGRITDAFFGLDTDWNFTYVNDRASKWIDPDGRGLEGTNIWEEFPAAVDSEFEEGYRRAMETQDSTTFEAYYPEPLNRWFEVHAYPSESGLSVYFRDVTDRKKREQEHDLFRTLLDHSTDGVLVIDPDSARILDVNETACHRLGYDREELTELSVLDIEEELPDIKAWRSHVDNVRNEGTVTFDGEHRRKDDTIYPVEVNVTYAELDQKYMLAVARDVTERRERERELEQYRALTQAANDVIVTIDERSVIRSINPTVSDVFGHDREELIGEPLTVLMPDRMADGHREAIERYLETGERTLDWNYLELPGQHADGSELPLSVSFSEVAFEDERFFTGILRDITEREEIKRQLEASNERLEQFAYAASHDLQEPLRMVTSYLRMIENRYGDELDEDGQEFIDFAVDGAERMREMIEGLLEYSRVENQGDPFEPVNLDDILQDVLADLQLQIEESDAEITAESLPRVEGDASQLRQVFQNLLDNAIEYSGDDPPRVHITAERREARSASERSSAERSSADHSSGRSRAKGEAFRDDERRQSRLSNHPREDGTAAETDGTEWVVSIRDEGIGINPDDADRIFEVFQRLHAQEEHTGTGIGLALCRRIIERHGGDIWVTSDPGEGTTFSFTLPAGDSDE